MVLNIAFSELGKTHQMALLELKRVRAGVFHHYRNFEFNQGVNDINKYIITELSARYIESIRDIVYAGRNGDTLFGDRRMAQYALYEILIALQQMLAPVVPILIEETWDYVPAQLKEGMKNPLQGLWADRSDEDWRNPQLEKDIPYLLQTHDAVKSALEMARGDKKMGSSLQSFIMLQCADDTTTVQNSPLELFGRYRDDMESLFVVSKVGICAGSLPSSVSTVDWSYKVDFEIAGSKVTAHVYSPQSAKCIRCWRYAAPLEVKESNALCNRCESVVEGLRQEQPELFEPPAKVAVAGAG